MLIVGHFAKNLEVYDFRIIDQILRYLAESLEKNIIFKRKSEFKLVRYSDSD